MNLTDSRLYQSANLEDLAFRFHFRDDDNPVRRIANREFNGLLGQGFIAPDTEKIWGVDVSDWDGNVDFEVSREYGASFAIIKAIDGTVPTKYFAANNARAIEAGLLNGAYGWLYPDNRVPCVLQARAYEKLLSGAWVTMPPVMDFEWTRYAGLQANPNYTDLRKWATEFIRIAGEKPILYSAAGYMNMFGKIPADLWDMFSGFWAASYGGLTLPYGITKWDMHQFTANGDALTLCPGDRDKKELDLNYMTPEFYSLLGGGQVSEPQEGNTMDRWRVVWEAGCNKRPMANTSNTAVGVLPMGTEFDVVAYFVPTGVPVTQECWGKLTDDYWVALTYASQPRAVQVSTPPPPPPADGPAQPLTITSIEAVFTLTDANGAIWEAVVTDAPNVTFARKA
jgi:GH25 family lysozyme M1 (1,4-beta-N-acetylmuramidase)